MASIIGRLVTFCGCLLSMASFCFLPYVVVPYTSFAFTGFQLFFLGPQIPLPNYYPYPTTVKIPSVLQNSFSVGKLVVLLVLTALLALAGLWPNQRLAKITAWGVIIGVGLTLLFSLCNLASPILAGFAFMNAHSNTLRGIVYGSAFTFGSLGIWLGMIIAFVGSVITLRAKHSYE